MITECVFMERLAEGGVLTVSDLSADEKKKIYQHFQQFEATEAWAYDRLFKEGFAAWEMRGVLGCKVDYLERLKNEGVKWEIREAEGTEAVENQIEPDLFHFRLYYLMPDGTEHSIDLNRKGDWWVMLGELKRRVEFGRWMQERGMKSLTTVTKRFSTDDWREFERCGIRNIIKSFCEK